MDTKQHKADKVDTLRHLSDHGLNLTFTCPKKIALLSALKAEGVHEVTSGQSSVTITRIGRVTFTDAFFAVGSNHVYNAHYLDGNLIFKCDDDRARLVLRSVILGEKLPSILTPRNGAGQDELRSWLNKNAWALLGEAGFRSKALEGVKSRFDSTVKTWDYRVRDVNQSIVSHDRRDYVKELQEAKGSFKFSLGMIDDNKAEHERICKDVEMAIDELTKLANGEAIDSGALSMAWRIGFTYEYKNGKRDYLFTETRDTRSHEYIRPNYVAKIDGEKLSLSSGIEVPFTTSQVIAWLKGEMPSPNTRYGICSVVNTSHQDGTPINLIKCGCHYIDASRDLGEPFASLLAPTHSVTVVKGLPAVYFNENPEGFKARCEAWKRQAEVKIEKRRELAVSDYVATCRKIRKARDEHSQNSEKLAQELVQTMASHAQAKLDLDNAHANYLGTSLEKALENGKALINALTSPKA